MFFIDKICNSVHVLILRGKCPLKQKRHRCPWKGWIGCRGDKLKKGEESYENLKRKQYLQELQRARDKKMKREVEREKRAKAKAIEDNVDVDNSGEAEETE